MIGEKKAGQIAEAMVLTVAKAEGVSVDYLFLVNPQTVQPLENVDERVLLASAIPLGRTQLIDNLALE
ncbi:MAG: pantoate--beta-alanine ligase [Candidatus Methylomirabilia bacterium]